MFWDGRRHFQQTNNLADTIRKHCQYILTKQTITYDKVTTVQFYSITRTYFNFLVDIYMHKPKTLHKYCRNTAFFPSSNRKHENIKPSKHYSQQTTDQKDVFIQLFTQKWALDYSNANNCS